MSKPTTLAKIQTLKADIGKLQDRLTAIQDLPDVTGEAVFALGDAYARLDAAGMALVSFT